MKLESSMVKFHPAVASACRASSTGQGLRCSVYPHAPLHLLKVMEGSVGFQRHTDCAARIGVEGRTGRS